MPEETTNQRRNGLGGTPMIVAVGAILVWVAFLIVMVFAADGTDLRWTRLSYVFGSVEAIAFAAAGALFGVTVQREQVKKAEEKAEANQVDANNGLTLAMLNIADEDSRIGLPPGTMI